jgi:hypothetical protein
MYALTVLLYKPCHDNAGTLPSVTMQYKSLRVYNTENRFMCLCTGIMYLCTFVILQQCMQRQNPFTAVHLLQLLPDKQLFFHMLALQEYRYSQHTPVYFDKTLMLSSTCFRPWQAASCSADSVSCS